jgi:hypothetical protein
MVFPAFRANALQHSFIEEGQGYSARSLDIWPGSLLMRKYSVVAHHYFHHHHLHYYYIHLFLFKTLPGGLQ